MDCGRSDSVKPDRLSYTITQSQGNPPLYQPKSPIEVRRSRLHELTTGPNKVSGKYPKKPLGQV